MRLYLEADSKKQIGYTPDWVKIQYMNEKNEDIEITLDVVGTIDYSNEKLDCRVKGDLIPWVLYNLESGDEIDFNKLEENEIDKLYPMKKIVDIFKKGDYYTVGVYPTMDFNEEDSEDDVLSDGEGVFECVDEEGNDYSIEFKFETRLSFD